MVDISRVVLAMSQTSYHGVAQILPKFRCNALPDCRAEFLDTQITGAVFMLQRSNSSIPMPPSPTPETDNAAAELQALATHGGIIADTMGLGKTYLALLFVNYTAIYQKRTEHKPCIILTPNGVVLTQLLQAIRKLFPDFTPILTHSERPTKAAISNQWVSAITMQQASHDLRQWP